VQDVVNQTNSGANGNSHIKRIENVVWKTNKI